MNLDVEEYETHQYIKSLITNNGFCVIQLKDNYLNDKMKIQTIFTEILGSPFVDKNPGKQIYSEIPA